MHKLSVVELPPVQNGFKPVMRAFGLIATIMAILLGVGGVAYNLVAYDFRQDKEIAVIDQRVKDLEDIKQELRQNQRLLEEIRDIVRR